jgi:hypothetical protein
MAPEAQTTGVRCDMDTIHLGRPWIRTLALLSVVGLSSLGCDAERNGGALALPDTRHKARIAKTLQGPKAQDPHPGPVLTSSPNIALLLLIVASGRYSVTAGRASSRYAAGTTRKPAGELKNVETAGPDHGRQLQASAAGK